MMIYEELKELEEEAECEKRNKTYTLAEREYYSGKAQAFMEARELFDKREVPVLHAHHAVVPFYVAKDVADFLPPERKK